MMKILSVMTVLIVVVTFAFCSCSKEQTESSGETKTQGGLMSTSGGDPEAMAVKVNDRIITNKEVADEENRLLQQFAGRP